jgi:hypothetical protein
MSKTISMRWLAAIVAGVVIGMFALTGTAAAPPGSAPVRIVDTDDASLGAHVDADGNLQVGGSVATTSSDDPGRVAFNGSAAVNITAGSLSAVVTIDIPDGMRLAVTHISGGFNLPGGQKPVLINLTGLGPGHVDHFFAPIFSSTDDVGRDNFAFSQDFAFYAEGELRFVVQRSGTGGLGVAFYGVSGYLIDCEAEPCN